MPTPLLQRTRSALNLVQSRPRAASRLALRLRAEALAAHDYAAASVAERALGLAAEALHDVPEGIAHLREAVQFAQRAGALSLSAEARMTLAGFLVQHGQGRRALAQIDESLAESSGLERARALAQRGAIHHHLGHLEAALADYRAALPSLVEHGDHTWAQRILMNRGLLLAERHQYAASAADMHAAEAICDEHGLAVPGAMVHENLALVYRRLGDVPAALHHLDLAERLNQQTGANRGGVFFERAELLMSVRLMVEARAAAAAAVAEHERAERPLFASEARLLLARTAEAEDPEYAAAQARLAERAFVRQGRPRWQALARFSQYVSAERLEGRLAALGGPAAGGVLAAGGVPAAAGGVLAPGPPGARLSVPRILALADLLSDQGWRLPAMDARLLAFRVAERGVGHRHRAAALASLEGVAHSRHQGSAQVRVRGWVAEALLRQARGRPGAAARAAAAGLRVVDDYRATLSATDLRATTGALGAELAGIGLAHAVASGTPWQVLSWAERGRARHLVDRPAAPPDDPDLALLLAQVRSVISELEEHRSEGDDVADLVRRLVALENAVRDRSRLLAAGSSERPPHLPPSRTELAGALGATLGGPAALVEFVESAGRLGAVVLTARRCVCVPLGPTEAIARQVKWVPFALRRLARADAPASVQAAAMGVLGKAARELESSLWRPLAGHVGEAPVVIVPTGVLQTLPWAVIPSLVGRPVTVAPTAGLWHRAARAEPVAGPVVVAAGPGLPGAAAEVHEVAALYGVRPLIGDGARAEVVASALDGCGLAHLAAHGSIRTDNPLFSSLRFADGPLTLYDIDRLGGGVDTVTLSACEGANSVVLDGDELLGFAATFLSGRARTVLGSIGPLPDLHTEPLMVALHRRLAGGETVAGALAAVRSSIDPTDPVAWPAAVGLQCLGAGFVPAALP